MFVLNFVISGKVTSLPKVIKNVKRSKYSFHDFSGIHTPSATLNYLFREIRTQTHMCLFPFNFFFQSSTQYDQSQRLIETLLSESEYLGCCSL